MKGRKQALGPWGASSPYHMTVARLRGLCGRTCIALKPLNLFLWQWTKHKRRGIIGLNRTKSIVRYINMLLVFCRVNCHQRDHPFKTNPWLTSLAWGDIYLYISIKIVKNIQVGRQRRGINFGQHCQFGKQGGKQGPTVRVHFMAGGAQWRKSAAVGGG